MLKLLFVITVSARFPKLLNDNKDFQFAIFQHRCCNHFNLLKRIGRINNDKKDE